MIRLSFISKPLQHRTTHMRSSLFCHYLPKLVKHQLVNLETTRVDVFSYTQFLVWRRYQRSRDRTALKRAIATYSHKLGARFKRHFSLCSLIARLFNFLRLIYCKKTPNLTHNERQMTYITEEGLISLLFACKLPGKRFRKWVLKEVLPYKRYDSNRK